MANQSVTISFTTLSGSSDISMQVDMDDEQNALANNGRTSSFIFGDEAFFRVFTNPVVGIEVSCFQSDGVISAYGKKRGDITDTAVFTQPPASAGGTVKDNTYSLSIPVYSGFVATGIPSGSSPCGVVSVSPTDPSVCQASLAGPGVYSLEYVAEYSSFSIKKDSIPPDWPVDDPYPITITIVGV